MNPKTESNFGMRTTNLPVAIAERGNAMSFTFGILILVIAMLGLVLPAQGAAPANQWWNSSYLYREKITVAAGSVNVPTQYSVRVQFNHAALVTATKSLSSGNDIRIVYWNGSTWTELDRRLDDQSAWNSTTTQVWFRTQAAINATLRNDNYYLYYGYSSAGTPPTTWSNIFLFYDDFNDGTFDNTDRWENCSGTCTESGGTLTLGPSVNSKIFAKATYSFGGDTRWETRVQLGATAVQYFNYCAAGNTSTWSDDWIDMWTTSSTHYVETADEGANGQDPYTPTTPTSFHVYGFNREGTSGVRYYQDGAQVGYRTANVPDENMRFLSHNDNTSSSQIHDWVRVRKYVTPEPTNFTGGEEVSSAFSYRKQITIQESQVTCTADMTSFPVLIKITSDDELRTVGNGGHVQNANGYDITFRAADGATVLDHEVEKYTASTGELVAWVRIPTLDYNDNTTIYLYYGNSAITSPTANPAGVWDSNYKGVWHLKESGNGTSGEFKDSTSNAKHGTGAAGVTGGGTPDRAEARIGYGQNFRGDLNANDAINLGKGTGLDNLGTYSLEAWIAPRSLGETN